MFATSDNRECKLELVELSRGIALRIVRVVIDFTNTYTVPGLTPAWILWHL